MSSDSKCPECSGTGIIKVDRQSKCPKCRGLGSTKIIVGSKPTNKDKCSECSGTGKITLRNEKKCPSCDGTGSGKFKCIICGTTLNSEREVCKGC